MKAPRHCCRGALFQPAVVIANQINRVTGLALNPCMSNYNSSDNLLFQLFQRNCCLLFIQWNYVLASFVGSKGGRKVFVC